MTYLLLRWHPTFIYPLPPPCRVLSFSSPRLTRKTEYRHYGLELVDGKVRDNLACGVVEPAISKIKSLRFATEAAITILRIGENRVDTVIVVVRSRLWCVVRCCGRKSRTYARGSLPCPLVWHSSDFAVSGRFLFSCPQGAHVRGADEKFFLPLRSMPHGGIIVRAVIWCSKRARRGHLHQYTARVYGTPRLLHKALYRSKSALPKL